MSLEPTAPRPASAFTADEERPITGRPFLVPLYVPHFTARSPDYLLALLEQPGFSVVGKFTVVERDRVRQRPLPEAG
jgi:hypothetical protein